MNITRTVTYSFMTQKETFTFECDGKSVVVKSGEEMCVVFPIETLDSAIKVLTNLKQEFVKQ